MRDLRLTHGGFYRHFNSKEELFVEAFGESLEELSREVLSALEGVPPGGELQALINRYPAPNTPTMSRGAVRLRPWRRKSRVVRRRPALRCYGF